jgi:hypothetical protein
MGSSGLPRLYGTIGASLALTLYALRDLRIRKAWRHYCPRPGYPFAIQQGSQFYSRSTARWLGRYILLNATSTLSKLQENVRIIHAVLDCVQTLKVAASHSAAISDTAQICASALGV